jgi:excisionase family DNA binding protein
MTNDWDARDEDEQDSGEGARSDPPQHEAAVGHWIGLEEASRRLGVSATTLRRWADAGVVKTFVTPGGHRRFDTESIRTLLPGSGGRLTMEQLGETPERISRAYRRASDRSALPWVGALDDSQRSAFREHGMTVARELLATLDASTESDRAAHLAAGSESAAQYGVAAAAQGISSSATVETFLRFRRPFLQELMEIARRRGLDTTSATDLLGRASDAFDMLLVATMRAYDGAGPVGRKPSSRRATPSPIPVLPARPSVPGQSSRPPMETR